MFSDHIITVDEHLAWFRSINQREDVKCLVFEFECRPVGLMYFTQIDRDNSKCAWGFYLGEETLPKGTGSAMGFLGVEFAFVDLGVRKLSGEVLAFNTASIRFHKRLGFVEEGHFVEHVVKNGKYEDVLSFALFKDHWQRNKSELEALIFTKR